MCSTTFNNISPTHTVINSEIVRTSMISLCCCIDVNYANLSAKNRFVSRQFLQYSQAFSGSSPYKYCSILERALFAVHESRINERVKMRRKLPLSTFCQEASTSSLLLYRTWLVEWEWKPSFPPNYISIIVALSMRELFHFNFSLKNLLNHLTS